MARGSGAYDDLAVHVRQSAKARAAIVIIVGGNKGNGCSVQKETGLALSLPALLRKLADDIEADTDANEGR